MLLCADAESARADLIAGSLRCPSCGRGRLGPWGRGRERAVRLHRGERAVTAPPRGRCRSCGATHMLLPSWMAPRRADGTGVIARAAAAAALHGAGSARLGAELGVPPATVRGWLRRLRSWPAACTTAVPPAAANAVNASASTEPPPQGCYR